MIFYQFLGHNSAISYQIPIKFESHTATTWLIKLSAKLAEGRPRYRPKVPETGEFNADLKQFLACNFAVSHPISLKLAPCIVTISPNNPLKFKPDLPRGDEQRAVPSGGRGPKSHFFADLGQFLARNSTASEKDRNHQWLLQFGMGPGETPSYFFAAPLSKLTIPQLLTDTNFER